MPPNMTWQASAACAGADPSLYVPDDPDDLSPIVAIICGCCPVHTDCLSYAMEHEVGERAVAIFAGKTARQRRALRRRQKRVAAQEALAS